LAVELGVACIGAQRAPECTDGAAESCCPGDSALRDVGACKLGARVCVRGAWSACLGYGVPSAEVCGNGVDDDCNGSTDDGCPCTKAQPCYSGAAAAIGVGTCKGGAHKCTQRKTRAALRWTGGTDEAGGLRRQG
jgi:hypothetical protein